jgi:Putative Flp pilus-assembly TadE/G-like
MRTEPRPTDKSDAMHGDEGGFVIVWMALMLLVLLAFCGFGIDVSHWWFVGQKQQRAADAAALAGSIYLPNDLATGQATALHVSAQNGYKNGVNATVLATQEPQPSRIRVTITTTITNFFAGLVGYNTQTIARDAVADFQGPVPMGSPTNKLGQDPDECVPATPGSCANFWLNTSGPKGTKREGDRFATEVCNDGTVANCTGTVNEEYNPLGYLYRVRVNSIVAGESLMIQVYDPAWIHTGDFCNTNMPTQINHAQITALTGAPWNITNVAPAPVTGASRYATSASGQSITLNGTRWCTGDQNAGAGSENNTSYIVRAPDSTPWTDVDNPIVTTATCVPSYFRGVDTPLQTLLQADDGSDPGKYVKNYFHRWATVCSIPSNEVVLGDYVLQVKTNSPTAGLGAAGPTYQTWSGGDPGGAATNNGRGYNRYALRAGWGVAPTTSSGIHTNSLNPNSTGVSISATRDLPIYANAGDTASPTFYLARITPTAGSGRTLLLNFYDIGDVGGGGSVNFAILAPGDSNYSGGFPTCTYHRDNAPAEVTAAGCTIPSMTTGVYNGRIVTVTIPIPANYTCTFADPVGCWIKVRMTYTTGTAPNDTTTWSATLAGDPVRLVE